MPDVSVVSLLVVAVPLEPSLLAGGPHSGVTAPRGVTVRVTDY